MSSRRASANAFSDYYRCPPEFADLGTPGSLSPESGYFACSGAIGFGRLRDAVPSRQVTEALPEVSCFTGGGNGRSTLPFDVSEVVTNLQREHYCQSWAHPLSTTWSASVQRGVYYSIRPVLPVGVRKHLQRARLNGWDRIPFPRWPVDFSVETFLERGMDMVLRRSGLEKLPFIWFWPDGAPSCAIMTHDIETLSGREFCGQLMDLDDSYGVKSSFQVIPEVRYEVPAAFLEGIRARGFEVNVHDLNHDGRLFESRERFLERVPLINSYGRAFQSSGFRAGAMYRQQEWFGLLGFSYDMSVPNVAHLEPQRGGCCTVTPYFVGKIVELPLTATQDYSLFHIIGDYSIALWKKQIDLIRKRHGLISFCTHPDYLIEPRARAVYSDLLAHLQGLREAGAIWMALPGQVDRWWRHRHEMTLVRKDGRWRIEGPDSTRAWVAYATLSGDRLVYRFDPVA